MVDLSVRVVTIAPPGYVHIAALADATDALVGGLLDAGCTVDRAWNACASPLTTMLNVIVGWHLLRDTEELTGVRAVAWQLEAVGEGGGWWNEDRAGILRAFKRVWDFDLANVEFLRGQGFPVSHLPLGHHALLERLLPLEDESVDVLMYGSPSPRRAAVAAACRELGLVVVELPSGTYGKERDAWIARAKCVLGVQYYPELGRFDQVRAAFLVANGRHYLVEKAQTTAPVARFVEEAAYAELPARAASWCGLHPTKRLEITSSRKTEFARHHPMKDYVALALEPLR